jgi:hypothetical protein
MDRIWLRTAGRRYEKSRILMPDSNGSIVNADLPFEKYGPDTPYHRNPAPDLVTGNHSEE